MFRGKFWTNYLSKKIQRLKEKISDHRGVFGLAFFTLGLVFNPDFNRYQSMKLQTFKFRKIAYPMPSTDNSRPLKHYFMSWEEYELLVNDFVVWVVGTGPNIFAWMIDDSIDAFYDDLRQSW